MEFINEIWECLTKLISENRLGLFSILVSILIGVASIKIARNSLIFNQRSLLLKDSYEPILIDIKDNYSIKLISSTEISYDKLRNVKESYVYHAFEKSDQELVDKILELEEKINNFKRKSDYIISMLLVNVLNKNYSKDVIETGEKGTQKVITEVFIGNKAIKNSKESFIDIFLNHGFHELVLFNRGEHIWCRWEEIELVKDHDGIEHQITINEKAFTLVYFLQKNINFDIDIPQINEDDVVITEIEHLVAMLNREFRSSKECINAEENYNKLSEATKRLEKELIDRIRKLIIPKKSWLEGIGKK